MIETKNKGEYNIHLYFHVVYYFIIIYISHYFIFYDEKENYIQHNVKNILDDRNIYKKFETTKSDRDRIEVIKECNKSIRDLDDRILYDIIMYIIVFTTSIFFIILVGNFYKVQIKRILYEGLVFFLTIFLLKIFFTFNIELTHERPSQKEMYRNITDVLTKNIKQ